MKLPKQIKSISAKVSWIRFWQQSEEYSSILTDDLVDGHQWEKATKRFRVKRYLPFIVSGIPILTLTGLLIYAAGNLFHTWDVTKLGQKVVLTANPFQPAKACKEPSVRQEWRTLTTAEQQHYIQAVKCLMQRPSKIRTNGTLYDDFPWIHTTSGSATHHSAAFLSWHRYFIHTYENTLKIECGYHGALAYWDWSLDWANLTGSPVWSPETGFGGDGLMNGEEGVGEGRCVTDGPFAGHTNLFYGAKSRPHCLSRGFTDGHGHNGSISGDGVHPEQLEDILSQEDFESFFWALEKGPHDLIPNGVRGDFFSFTAPYDPVFYLHHTQLDRLWWLWQERSPRQRHFEYTGPKAMGSDQKASVYDLLPMSDFVEPLRVMDIMNTESDFLCYRYTE